MVDPTPACVANAGVAALALAPPPPLVCVLTTVEYAGVGDGLLRVVHLEVDGR
jgi:hypothetical protein